MRRREFITLLGGAAAFPLGALAQQPAMPVIGFLSGQSPRSFTPHLAAFHQGLKQTGHVEGRNVAVEYRWAEGQRDRLPGLAADLVQRRVAVISATGGLGSSLAATAATATVPIVFGTGGDPVKDGLVTSLNRPGGNVTGISWFNAVVTAKRLGLLHELVPGAGTVAMLISPSDPDARTQLADVQDAARVLGRRASSSMPPRRTKSTRPSLPWYSSGPRRSSSRAIPSTSTGATRSSRSRRATPCRRSIPIATTSQRAA